MTTLEFKINSTISLKLENEEVNIYLNGELFKQCKAILLNRQFNELEDLNSIKSIDDLADNFEHVNPEFDDDAPTFSSETLFWAHCSNIQTWVENYYDTRLLHSNLAFPLLKKLADLGDNRARQRFSEEVLKRFNEGSDKTKEYLIFEDFLQYINDENKHLTLLNEDDALLLIQLSKKYKIEFRVETLIPPNPQFHDSYITIKDKKLTGMGLRLKDGRAEVPKEIALFKNLKNLTVYLKNIDFKTEHAKYSSIEGLILIIGNSNEKIPIKINNLHFFPNLKGLTITNELVYNLDVLFDKKKIGETKRAYIEFCKMENIERLEIFNINSCKLVKFPLFLSNAKNLNWLNLKNSDVGTIPKKLFEYSSLEVVKLDQTVLKEIPNTIINYQKIKFFSCEPFLITSEIENWLKINELEQFDIKSYKKKLFLNF